MKKSNLWTGLVYLLIGAACLASAMLFDTRLDAVLFGFSGAGITGGLMILFKYFYWVGEKNKDRYTALSDKEQIKLHDERNKILRDRSGRYAYVVGLVVISLSIVIFVIVDGLDFVLTTRFFVLYLSAYFLFQYVIGIVIFRHLHSKY